MHVFHYASVACAVADSAYAYCCKFKATTHAKTQVSWETTARPKTNVTREGLKGEDEQETRCIEFNDLHASSSII